MMYRVSLFLVAGALALTVSGSASAGLIFWDGTMIIRLGSLPPSITAGSGVSTVSVSTAGNVTTLRLAGGISIPSTDPTVILITDEGNPSIVSVIGTAKMGTGTLGPFKLAGTTGETLTPLTLNTMPLPGNFKLCLLLVGCGAWLDVPVGTPSGNKGLGVGGTITVNGFGAGFRLSFQAAPWTVQTVVLTGVYTQNAMVPAAQKVTTTSTATGFAHGPASETNSVTDVNGVIQVVTPVVVNTTVMPPNNFLGAPADVRLRFTPEPGLMLLLASGVGGLALLGRNRLRR
jgi:hypothetical protein